MQDNHNKLIKYLMDNIKPILGKELAEYLNISRRTIINYIKEINAMMSNAVIISTPNGYFVNRKAAAQLLDESTHTIPQNYQERSFYILKAFLINHIEMIDIYDLCDELCISISLLKNEIKKMNQSYSYLDIKFVTKNNCIQIVGSEKSKRQLMNHVILRMQDDDLISINQLKNYYPPEIINNILSIIENSYTRHHYYLNDFSRVNLLLHILIMVNRINSGNTINQVVNHTFEATHMDALISEIKTELEKAFAIQINDNEYIQLYLLINSHSVYNTDTLDTLNQYLEGDLLSVIKEIMKDVGERYYLEFRNESFIIMFTLHIKNLLFRQKAGTSIDNPLKNELRNTLPFLYDVALYIVERVFPTQHSLFISEDEISFIVIHLAAEIERNKIISKCIKCLLFVPKYLNMEQEVSRKILYYYGNQLTITKTLSYEDTISDYDFDLLITTNKTNHRTDKKTVIISPFISNTDKSALNDAIIDLQNEKQLEYLTINFNNYFEQKNFTINQFSDINQDWCIRYLCDLLYDNHYVDDEFYCKVMSRERAISTGYNGFAIPHAFNVNSVSNKIAVLIAPNGIMWEQKTVYVVFLMTIAPDTLIEFQELYSSLSLLLTETDIISDIRTCKTFEHFKQILINSHIN